jgi:ribosome biogenesis GTPase A
MPRYRSEDLEQYIDEVGDGKKKRLLVLNKADYLSYELREQWAR